MHNVVVTGTFTIMDRTASVPKIKHAFLVYLSVFCSVTCTMK